MTAIAIWHNHETQDNPSLWIAADSLVSKAQSTLIEDAAKILSLPIVCRSPDSQGFFSNVYYAHTYGYCFAGSTLMGQNAYLFLTPLLSNLNSQVGYIPSLKDIAQYTLRYLLLTFDEYKLRVSENAMFEVAIFGYCHSTNQLSAFHFSPVLQHGQYQMTMTEYPDMRGNDFIYLGDHKNELRLAIAKGFSTTSTPGQSNSRAPRHVIQDCIDRKKYQTIGGDIQLGIADKFGFRPFTLLKPPKAGQPEPYFSYLGRKLPNELMQLGNAMVFTNTMA